MLKILETIKAKLEALEAKGIAEVREIIEHAEELIGLHKAPTDAVSTDAAATVDTAVAADVASETATSATDAPTANAGDAPTASA